MADSTITALAPLSGADAQPAVDVLAVADVSTAETKKIKLSDVVSAGITAVPPGTIPGSALVAGSVTSTQIGAGEVGTSELADNSVTTAKISAGAVTAVKIANDSITAAQIAPDAISASELADNSVDGAALQLSAVDSVHIVDGSVTSVKLATGAVTSAAIANGGIDTADLADGAVTAPKLADNAVLTDKISNNAVTTDKLDDAAVIGAKIALGTIGSANLQNDLDGSEFLAQPANLVLAGPETGGSAVTNFRQLVAADLPNVPSAKLPIASSVQTGVVEVGSGLTASVSGVLSIANTATAGTATKVEFDQHGLIKQAIALAASDIPPLPASQITSGQFSTDFIADKAVTVAKLANYAISFIQEANPGTLGVFHIGMLWYQESTSGLHMWNGNSWMPISIGRLSQENLRYCGTIDASTGQVNGVTTFGTAAGYSIGDALGTASNERTGVYFVISVPGSAIPETPGVTYDNGDWVLCNGEIAGWERIDTLSGGGGGGGATNLPDLLDVTITSAVAGDILEYQASGQWTNVDSLSGGTY